MNKPAFHCKLLAACFCLYLGATQAAILSVDTIPGGGLDNTVTTAPGSNLSIDILLDAASDLAGFQFDLVFDSSILTVNPPIVSGNIFGLDTFLIADTINVGSLTFAEVSLAFGPGLEITVPTLLATINFDVIGAGNSALTLNNVVLSDSIGGNIPVTGLDNGLLISRVQPPNPSVPEPAAYLLLIASLIGLLLKSNKSHAFSTNTVRIS
ncbi:MAG: cohesin domain-containing protein [Gammaproteobacteria bacterium]